MNIKHAFFLLTLSLSSSMTLTAASLLYIERVNMVDFVASKHGFPYWWLIHINETFAGITDTWRLETANLAKDMTLFFLLSLGFWFLILLSKQRMTLTTKMKRKSS